MLLCLNPNTAPAVRGTRKAPSHPEQRSIEKYRAKSMRILRNPRAVRMKHITTLTCKITLSGVPDLHIPLQERAFLKKETETETETLDGETENA